FDFGLGIGLLGGLNEQGPKRLDVTMRICDQVNFSNILPLVHGLGPLHGNLTPRGGCEYAANEVSQSHVCTSPVSAKCFGWPPHTWERWHNPNWDALLYERVGDGRDWKRAGKRRCCDVTWEES